MNWASHLSAREEYPVPVVPETQSAFNQLKLTFITVPILAHPDAMKAFLIEADTSSMATGDRIFPATRNQTNIAPTGLLFTET